MPILKVKKNGEWTDVSNSIEHRHVMGDIDGIDVLTEHLEELQGKIGIFGLEDGQTVKDYFGTIVDAKINDARDDDNPEGLVSKDYVAEQYALKTDIPDTKGFVQETDMQTYVQAEIEKVDVSDQLADYALKTEIPSTEGFVRETDMQTYVQQKIDAIPDVDLTGYATETYVKNEIAKASISGGNGEGGGSSVFVQPDWNQNDETQMDFIRNKPFGVEKTKEIEEVILPETTLDGFEYNPTFGAFYFWGGLASYSLEVGLEYTVVWDGEEYPRTTFAFTFTDGSECVGIGNALAAGGSDSGEPFCIVYDKTNSQLHYFSTEQDVSHTVSITTTVTETYETQLDNKYLPILDYVESTVLFDGSLQVSSADMDTAIVTDSSDTTLVVGQTYIVTWNGEKYECECIEIDGIKGIGNEELFTATGDNGIPFIIGRDPTGASCGVPFGVWAIMPTAILTGAVISMDVDCKIEAKDYYKLKAGVSRWDDIVDKPDESSYLPDVTTDDNGKVLTVVKGAWVAQTPASGLPTVTASDAGKFLRVSSTGAWAVEPIPNAEEASF